MVAGQVGEIPRCGGIALSNCIRAINQRDVVEFRPPYSLRLKDHRQKLQDAGRIVVDLHWAKVMAKQSIP